MSRSQDPAPVFILGGERCPKCGIEMLRFKHSEKWKPQPGRGFFAWWDRCFKCRYFQNYPKAHRA